MSDTETSDQVARGREARRTSRALFRLPPIQLSEHSGSSKTVTPLVTFGATPLASRTTPKTLSLVLGTADEGQRRAACGAKTTAHADAPFAAASQSIANDQENRRKRDEGKNDDPDDMKLRHASGLTYVCDAARSYASFASSSTCVLVAVDPASRRYLVKSVFGGVCPSWRNNVASWPR
jgi:hypothetical protein